MASGTSRKVTTYPPSVSGLNRAAYTNRKRCMICTSAHLPLALKFVKTQTELIQHRGKRAFLQLLFAIWNRCSAIAKVKCSMAPLAALWGKINTNVPAFTQSFDLSQKLGTLQGSTSALAAHLLFCSIGQNCPIVKGVLRTQTRFDQVHSEGQCVQRVISQKQSARHAPFFCGTIPPKGEDPLGVRPLPL